MPIEVRSSSSPNVLDDSWIHGSSYSKTTSKNPPQGLCPENVKEGVDRKGFRTVPNRVHADSGPKRCPLSADLFQNPSSSTIGDASIGGFEVKNSQSGPYCLLGSTSSKATTPQPNLELQYQKQKPADEDPRKTPHAQSQTQPKRQSEPPKTRPKMGAYALVGIPETESKTVKPTPVFIPAPFSSNHPKGNTAIPVQNKGGGSPVEVKEKPIAEPSYELVGHLQPPGKMVPAYPMQQPKLENTLDVKKDAKMKLQGSPLLNRRDDQQLFAKSNSVPDVSIRRPPDGEAQASDDATIGPGMYTRL